MPSFKPNDLIHNQDSATIWRVLAVNRDGTLEVEFVAGKKNAPWRKQTIERPEYYRKVKDDDRI